MRTNFRFYEGGGLVEFLEGYHRYQITNWARCADPNENKGNFRHHAETERALKEAIAKARAREHRTFMTEDSPEFKSLAPREQAFWLPILKGKVLEVSRRKCDGVTVTNSAIELLNS